MIIAMENSTIELTFEFVKNKLLSGSFSREDDRVNPREDAAYLSKGAKRNPKWKPRCFGCQKIGQIIAECPNRGSSQGTAAEGSSHHFSGSGLSRRNTESSKKPNNKSFLYALSAKADKVNKWYVDSGSSKHFSGNKKLFSRCDDLHEGNTITIANDHQLKVSGSGSVPIRVVDSDISEISDVMYVQDWQLLSYMLVDLLKRVLVSSPKQSARFSIMRVLLWKEL